MVQAVPGVHDLNQKFVSDPRRVESYYSKPSIEEFTPSLPKNVQILSEHKSAFGSRKGKHQIMRKDSYSVHTKSSHLSSTRSQTKIMTQQIKNSQRSSSAVRSP